jgi:hypothetical protein
MLLHDGEDLSDIIDHLGTGGREAGKREEKDEGTFHRKE